MIARSLLFVSLCLLSAQSFAATCTSAPLPDIPGSPSWTTTIERFGEEAEMTVWRNRCSESEADLLVRFTPLDNEIFICTTRFDVIQDGVQFDDIDLVPDPADPFDRFCGDLLVPTTMLIEQDEDGQQFDPLDAFTLIHDSDQRLEVEAASGPGETAAFRPLYEETLPSNWFDNEREGDFSIGSMPNYFTVPSAVPKGCFSVIPGRFAAPPANPLVDDQVTVEDLAGTPLDIRVRLWRLQCHSGNRSALLMNIELLDNDLAPLLPRPSPEIRSAVNAPYVPAFLSEFPAGNTGEVAPLGNIGIANRIVRINGDDVETGPTFVVDAFDFNVDPNAYNESISVRLTFGSEDPLVYSIPAVSAFADDTQLPEPALHGRYSGQWVAEDLPRSGLVLQVGEAPPDRVFVFAIWFTYLDGAPFWVTGNGDIEAGANEITLDMVRLQGGDFLTNGGSFSADDVTVDTVGTMTLRAVDCNSIEGSADFSPVGLGTTNLELDRLIRIAGYDCDQTQ
jgi:hypothetical protein